MNKPLACLLLAACAASAAPTNAPVAVHRAVTATNTYQLVWPPAAAFAASNGLATVDAVSVASTNLAATITAGDITATNRAAIAAAGLYLPLAGGTMTASAVIEVPDGAAATQYGATVAKGGATSVTFSNPSEPDSYGILYGNWTVTGALTAPGSGTLVARASVADALAIPEGAESWIEYSGTQPVLVQVTNSTSVYVVSTNGAGYNGPVVGAAWTNATKIGINWVWTTGGGYSLYATGPMSVFGCYAFYVASVPSGKSWESDPQKTPPASLVASGGSAEGGLVLDWVPITNRYNIATMPGSTNATVFLISQHDGDSAAHPFLPRYSGATNVAAYVSGRTNAAHIVASDPHPIYVTAAEATSSNALWTVAYRATHARLPLTDGYNGGLAVSGGGLYPLYLTFNSQWDSIRWELPFTACLTQATVTVYLDGDVSNGTIYPQLEIQEYTAGDAAVTQTRGSAAAQTPSSDCQTLTYTLTKPTAKVVQTGCQVALIRSDANGGNIHLLGAKLSNMLFK
jgi:hypothetical protein